MQSRDKCLFPHYKVEEQPKKKNRKKRSQNGTSDDKGAVAFVKTVLELGCLGRLRVIRTSEKREVSGKPEAESFGINSTGTIHTVCAMSSKYPRK